ncbi:hypothetical protein GHT06_015982 [Daphnia sinensis]|uniref:CUB domain-containing protein n=1 Tax=Daphnia sinensis TaxID=1820382 RepID=A0AAD5LBJ7_9CRUS|nr:hypothetical protein GHT06_015982 [Daphnia sinensis]
MFARIVKFVLLASCFQAGNACKDNTVDQPALREDSSMMNNVPSTELTTNPWLSYYYNSQNQGRSPAGNRVSGDDQRMENRAVFSIPSMFPNRLFGNGNIVNPFIFNPRSLFGKSSSSSVFPYDSCSSPNGVMGICATSGTCNQIGGSASGSCAFGTVCCINIATNCGGTVSLNNTYWQSPTTGISSSTTSCALTIKLDTKLTEQPKPICQVRLNFVQFTIAQPDAQSLCTNGDFFDVGGQTNKVPTICGDNEGQHMYLNVPSSATNPTDLELAFTFGAAGATRVWNIMISMLPCEANYLAPPDCLQYFPNRSGRVSSFNWRDVPGTSTRQLANQDYSICFRRTASNTGRLCFTPCVTVNQLPIAFSISVAYAIPNPSSNPQPGFSQGISTDCNNDFLVIPGGFDPTNPTLLLPNRAFDRFCGERLNPRPLNPASVTVCTTTTPFRIAYQTNGDETTTPTLDPAANGNRGFCLNFQHCFFLFVTLMFHRQASCAWEDESGEQESKTSRQVVDNSFRPPYKFPAYPWQFRSFPGYPPLYQPSFRVPQIGEEAITVLSQDRHHSGYTQSCRSSCTGEKGNCFDAATCSALGGRASGDCLNGNVCCINVVNTCHGKYSRHSDAITLNNTYWQSSLRPIPASSSCTLTVKLDARPEAMPVPLPIPPVSVCQVRLSFLVFTISQPDSESVCSGDYFEVVGATNTVPNICGFNDGQHMYLHVPPSGVTPTDLQLTFNFGSSDIETRAWNILISMIPCDSPRLAPADCLQYFTTRSGSVQTFNWRDVVGTATRQLANQDYSICFRSAPYAPKQLCLTPCTVVTTQKPFSLSTPSTLTLVNTVNASTPTPDVSQTGSLDCNNDFIVIPGGFNIANPAPVPNMAFDRYCGERLNALPRNNASTTVCTTATPFRVLYRTNRDETQTTPTADAAPNSIPANGNRGFCLNFRLQ